MNRLNQWIAMLAVLVTLTACIGGTPNLAGNWLADDGTGMKVILENGQCTGMYYSGGEPLDIGGGGMMCSMSSDKDSRGYYTLVVTQHMNQTTQYVKFDGDDTATVYDSARNKLFTMKRQ